MVNFHSLYQTSLYLCIGHLDSQTKASFTLAYRPPRSLPCSATFNCTFYRSDLAGGYRVEKIFDR